MAPRGSKAPASALKLPHEAEPKRFKKHVSEFFAKCATPKNVEDALSITESEDDKLLAGLDAHFDSLAPWANEQKDRAPTMSHAEEFLRANERSNEPASSEGGASKSQEDAKQTPAEQALPLPATPSSWLEDPKKLVEVCEMGSAKKALEELTSVPLTKDNLELYQSLLSKMAHNTAARADSRGDTHLDPQLENWSKSLTAAIKTGTMDARSTMGNKFRLAHKQGPDAERYKTLATRAECQAFKLEWMQKELKKVHEQKKYVRTWTRQDTTHGVFMNFDRLVVHLGGYTSEEAKEGASNCACKCVALGPPWVQTHPQTKLTEFLVLQMEWAEEFKEQWGIYKKSVVEEGEDPLSPRHAALTAAESVGGLAPKPGLPKAQTTPSKNKNEDNKEYAQLWKDAVRLRSEIQSSMSQAGEMIKNINEDEKWQWAKATEEKRLKGAVDALRGSLTPWEHDLLLADDPRRLAKESTKERIVCELRHFLDQAKLQKQLKSIVLGVRTAHKAIWQDRK